jgi:homoserine kinase
VPWFDGAREAARAAGAPELSISGSGPAVFAPCPNRQVAEAVRDAVVAWLAQQGIGALSWVTRPGPGSLDQ